MRFRRWCQLNNAEVFDRLRFGDYPCIPRECLLPEDFASHVDQCEKHPPGTAASIRQAASAWISHDLEPTLHLGFAEWTRRGERTVPSWCFSFGSQPSTWKRIIASWNKIPRKERGSHMKELLQLAALYEQWGRGGEAPLPEDVVCGDVVYFICAPVENSIKIGFSSDFSKRFNDLNRRPSSLYTVAISRGSYTLEKLLHDLFAAERTPGTEWFRPTMRLLGFIQRVRALGDAEKALKEFIDSDGAIATCAAIQWSNGEQPVPEAAE